VAFMRMYGMQGDPGPRPAPKRKSAAAGPRAKAARKRVVRGQRATRAAHGAPKGPGKKKGRGLDLGALASNDRVQAAINQLRGGNLAGAAGSAIFGSGNAPRKGGGGGGSRRRKNPANVKALRRSLSRVEGFGKLVKRVNAMLPHAHRFQVHPVLKHKRKRKSA
jgi:hypothetical protein